jgi:cytoskeletal protein CcmA (bactofilin family)
MAEPNENASSLVVGEGVHAKGTFQVPGRAVINGTIEGELVAKDIVVGPTGRGIGKFTAETGDVRGEILETVITTKSLIVRATGRVSGNVFYRELEIEKGGRVQGNMSQDAEPAKAERKEAAASSPAASSPAAAQSKVEK